MPLDGIRDQEDSLAEGEAYSAQKVRDRSKKGA